MQSTRQAILEYLKKNGHATVDELAGFLALTPVTVRHHLDILRSENLVGEPIVRHRTSRGRPQYVFVLTGQASAHFPKTYDALATKVLDEVRAQGGDKLVNVIFEGVAARLRAAAPAPPPGEPLAARMDRAVGFLNIRGYVAHWEQSADGALLYTCNCPYEALADRHPELCNMDLVLVGNLVGVLPQRVSRLAQGDASCAYLFKETAAH